MGGKGSGGSNQAVRDRMEAISDYRAYYKEQAEMFRKNKIFKQEYFLPMIKRMEAYIEDQRNEEKPLTIAGLVLATGVGRTSFDRMKKGEMDFELYIYCDDNGLDINNLTGENIGNYYMYPTHIREDGTEVILVPVSDLIERVLMLQQEETERRLYEKGRVGDIFSLKAQHGWQEEDKPNTVNQTLVIADTEQARKAIELLK